MYYQNINLEVKKKRLIIMFNLIIWFKHMLDVKAKASTVQAKQN